MELEFVNLFSRVQSPEIGSTIFGNPVNAVGACRKLNWSMILSTRKFNRSVCHFNHGLKDSEASPKTLLAEASFILRLLGEYDENRTYL
jgi:hypothetical protein